MTVSGRNVVPRRSGVIPISQLGPPPGPVVRNPSVSGRRPYVVYKIFAGTEKIGRLLLILWTPR